MKKGVILFVFLFLVLGMSSFVISIESSTSTLTNETQKIDKAYDCLETKIGDCSSLSLEEQIFSLMATGECEAEVKDAQDAAKCWPKGSCNVKTTAQAVLALDRVDVITTDAETWLFSKNKTPTDLEWYLQIELPDGAGSCAVSYSGQNYSLIVNEDRTLSNGAGTCLTLAYGNYWLRISPSCYDSEFTISCEERFLTNLLFKKGTSTIHVSEHTHEGTMGGYTTEKIGSLCFSDDGANCDYLGSLWATLVLDGLGHDTSDFIPYLTSLSTSVEHRSKLPDAFLSQLIGEPHRNTLLQSQDSGGWWLKSGDKYYDTALALFPFSGETGVVQKTNSKEWLLGDQTSDGCWDNDNVRNTAFLLYSIWPKPLWDDNDVNHEADCGDSGGYCMSSFSCTTDALGTQLAFNCPYGSDVCCDTALPVQSCSTLSGTICTSFETICSGGTWRTDVSDSFSSGEGCCVGGTCQTPGSSSSSSSSSSGGGGTTCSSFGGTCKASCDSGETQNDDGCGVGSDVCCVAGSGGGSLWFIWILVGLIVLVVVGILFKDKLRPLFLKLKLGGGGPVPRKGPGPSIFGPPSSSFPPRRPPRRMMPPSPGRPPMRRAPTRPQGELDSVLKKLKDMGK